MQSAAIDWKHVAFDSAFVPSTPRTATTVGSTSNSWVVTSFSPDSHPDSEKFLEQLLAEAKEENFKVVVSARNAVVIKGDVDVVGCFHAEGEMHLGELMERVCYGNSPLHSEVLLGIVHAYSFGAQTIAIVPDLSAYVSGSLALRRAAVSQARALPRSLPVVDPAAAVSASSVREPILGSPFPPECTLFAPDIFDRPVVPYPPAALEYVIRLGRDRHGLSPKASAFFRPGTLGATGSVSSVSFYNRSSLWTLVGFTSLEGGMARSSMVLHMVSQRLVWELDPASVGLRPILAESMVPIQKSDGFDREVARLVKYLLQWVAPPRNEANEIAAVALQLADDLVAAGFLRHSDFLLARSFLLSLARHSPSDAHFPSLTPTPFCQKQNMAESLE